MSRRTKIILAVVALLVVGGIVAFVALGQGGGGVEVETATVQEEDLSVTVTASGKVESGVSADVYPPAAGTLESVEVEEGAIVKAGATIAIMDREPLVQSVLQAEAAVAAAQSQLSIVNKQVPSSADLAAASANTDAAWTAYEAAVDALDAANDQAPSRGDIAAADAATNAAWTAYQTALTAYELLKAAIEASPAPAPSSLAELAQLKTAKDQAYAAYLQAAAAEASLRAYDGTAAESQAYAAADQAYAAYLGAVAQENTLITSSVSAERDAAVAQLEQARQALEIAMDTLAGAEMTAPIDGIVVFNAVGTPDAQGAAPVAEAGVAVAPQTAPFTVVDLDGVSFLAEVDEVDVGRLDLGMLGLAQLDAFPSQSFEATVTRIEEASQLTATGGTVFPVHLAFEETSEELLIGMQGDVGIEVSSVPSALTIPIEALFDEGGTSYVYIVEDGALARTEVEIGTLTETQVQVLAGVSDGQTVALSGPTELVDGMAVTVAE